MTTLHFIGDALAPDAEFTGLLACLGRHGATRRGPVHMIASGSGASEALRLVTARALPVVSLTLIAPEAANLVAPAGLGQAGGSMDKGDARAAARGWIDARHGTGTFDRSSPGFQAIASAKVASAVAAARADLQAPLTNAALERVDVPVLTLLGPIAPVGRLSAMPFLRVQRFHTNEPHLAEPHVAHPMIREFLARAEARWQDMTGPVDLAA